MRPVFAKTSGPGAGGLDCADALGHDLLADAVAGDDRDAMLHDPVLEPVLVVVAVRA
jgi:hypothetical protein